MNQVYVNGRFCEQEEATVSIFDRGFLFADAAYEVTTVIDGKLVSFMPHMQRLERSLVELKIHYQVDADALLDIHRELIRRNGITEGTVYIQVSRGAGRRDFLYSKMELTPTVVLFTQQSTVIREFPPDHRYSVITLEDLRWGRRDIKSVQLLYQSMAKTQAVEQGADDAWLLSGDHITEGTSNNAFIVLNDSTIVTRELSYDILHGTTRKSVLECARELGLDIQERAFSIAEIATATEAFSTSSSTLVNPVTHVNGQAVGDGKPGRITRRLYDIYLSNSRANLI